MENPNPQNPLHRQAQPLTLDNLLVLVQPFFNQRAEAEKNSLEIERMRIEVEKSRIEAERKTEIQNKIYGGVLVLASLSTYTFLLWNGKASEGFGVLITTVITSSLAGIFKGLIGRNKNNSQSEDNE